MKVLRRSRAPIIRKKKLLVVLALEERAGAAARETGSTDRRREYGAAFGKFLVTHHPAGLPGEIPGQGIERSLGGPAGEAEIIDPMGISRTEHVLVSVFDIDTQVFPEYFSRLTYVFLTAEIRSRAIYQPIPLFTNNIYEAPCSRASSRSRTRSGR